MVALATAFVRLRLDTSGTRDDVERGLKGAGGEKTAQSKGKSIGAAFSKGFEDGGGTFSRVAATMAARATLVAGAVAAATPAVTHFVAALAPAAGAGAALPAVLTSIKVASATAKIAVMGVGDAISSGFGDDAKAASEDLKKLHGNARIFAQQVISLQPKLEKIQRTTANRFFAPLLNEIKPLANTFFPTLRREVPQTAGALGRVAEKVAQVAREGPAVRALNAIFNQTQGALKRIETAVRPVVNGIANGLASTAPAIGTLAGHFTTLATRFGNFLTQGAKTGLFIKWINEGIATIKTLAQIIINLGAITGTVFGEAVGSSADLLVKIRDLTAQARTFVESAKGTKVIADLFQTMGVFGDALKRSLAGVLPEVGKALAITAPVAGQLAQAIANLLISLGPLLPALAGVTAQMVTLLIPALTEMAKWLGENEEVLRVIAPVILGYVAATKIAAVATAAHTVAIRAWSIAVGIAKTAQAAWTAVSWLASAPVHVHTAAMKLSTSTLGTWVGVKRIEAASWLASTAATVKDTAVKVANRVATLAHAAATGIAGAAMATWTTIQTVATGAAVGLRVATIALWTAMKAHPFIAIISIITIVIGFLIKLYKENETFRRIVDAVWAAIKKAIKAVGDWFTGTLWPSIKRALDQLRGAFQVSQRVIQLVWRGIQLYIRTYWGLIRGTFNAIRTFITQTLPNAFKTGVAIIRTAWNLFRSHISTIWNNVRGIFNSLRTFITQTIPNAFRTGVAAITRAWNAVQQAARKPVSFVVNSVINPLVNGWNSIAGIFGAPKAPTIKGFAEGGRIPGRASSTDNRLADLTDRSGRRVGKLAVATGEYVVNSQSTSKWLPVLEAINRKGRNGLKGVNPMMDGLADGGLVGWAKGLIGKGASAAKGLFDTITDPSKALKKLAEGAINRIPGGGAIRDMLVGAGRNLVGKVIAKIKDVFSFGGGAGSFGAWPSSPSAQRGDSGVWRRIVAMIRATGPLSGSFGNGYRPGDPKWHGSGRAVDWMGYNQDALASLLASRRPLELIHRTRNRDYAYTRGKNKGSFNSALMNAHKNHIHIAMALGGLVDKIRGRLSGLNSVQLMDRGGTLRPGLNTVYNGTGAPERLVRPDNQPTRLHPADLEALGRIIGREITAAIGGANYAAGRRSNLYTRGG
jgi:hypothetical protein